jgi:hypothetical protein
LKGGKGPTPVGRQRVEDSAVVDPADPDIHDWGCL